MAVSLRRAGRQAPPEPPAALHAPLFQALINSLDAKRRHVVLDLGAASTEMLALLGRSRCRVDVADLAHFRGIGDLNNAKTGPALADIAESLLPNRLTSEATDLVFCWDLPNYLTLNALSALMAAIARRCRPGSLVHTLIFYAESHMNERPGRYVPGTSGALVNLAAPTQPIAAPRYSPENLDHSMRPFTIDRARLLSNGMQEFLLRLHS